MQYVMLIHHDEAALAAADQRQLWSEYAAFNEARARNTAPSRYPAAAR